MNGPEMKYRIELNLKDYKKIKVMPCGIKLPVFIVLEDIWEKTGCDVEGENGVWYCDHCNSKYYFHLYHN